MRDGNAQLPRSVQWVLGSDQAGDLTHEEGVAVSSVVNHGDLSVPRHRARNIFDEPPDLPPVHALQTEDLALTNEISEGFGDLRRPNLSYRAVRDDNEHPRCANLPHQELKQQDRRAVAGKQVIEDEQQRASRRGVLEELRDHLEDVEARSI